MSQTVLTNAKIVLPDEVITGTLMIENGQIAAIDAGGTSAPDAIDCEGDLLAPGLIELHTDNIERHLTPRPGVSWPHANAILAHDAELAGLGITTVFDALRVGSAVSRGKSDYRRYARDMANEILEMRAKGVLKISHFLHLRAEICSETLADELDEFGPEDRIGIVSLMDHTPGQRQFADLTQLRVYMRGKHGMTDADFDDHVTRQRELGDKVRVPHERAAVSAAKGYGATLASHDDTTQEHVDISARHGVRLAEFPTTMEAARACHSHGIAVMMGAPNLVRGGSHSGNVAAHELAADARLDILSSDYIPASLLMGAVQLGQLQGALHKGLAAVSDVPARAVGLQDRGRIEVGLRADLIRVRLLGDVPIMRETWVRGERVA